MMSNDLWTSLNRERIPSGTELGDDEVDRLAALYRDDTLLGRSFAVAREAQTMMDGHDPGGMGSRTTPVVELAKAAGEIPTKPDGPRVATIDFGGWDTHISQQGEYS